MVTRLCRRYSTSTSAPRLEIRMRTAGDFHLGIQLRYQWFQPMSLPGGRLVRVMGGTMANRRNSSKQSLKLKLCSPGSKESLVLALD